MALDHRGSVALLVPSVDPTRHLKEFLGLDNDLCGGLGGHRQLLAPELLAASLGIVGSSEPGGVGLALAGRCLKPGSLTLAFLV